MKTAGTIAAVVAVLAMGGVAQADSIGVNFKTAQSANIAAAALAGAPDYEQTYWNNLTGDSTGKTLVDGQNGDTSLFVDYITTQIGYYSPVTTAQNNTANGNLFKGSLERNNDVRATVDLSSIPYAQYDLVVYYAGLGYTAYYAESDGKLIVTDGGSLDEAIQVRPHAHYNTLFSGTFTEADWTDPGYVPTATTTHAVFTGLTASSITLQMGSWNSEGDLPGTRVDEDSPGLVGFQIINMIPEPASAALLILGGVGVLLRRRRRS